MRKILANENAMVVYISGANEYWLVTVTRGVFNIECLDECSPEYGHSDVRKTFVQKFGEPTFERKSANDY